MDRDSFFENIRNDNTEHAEALREQRQLAYEERCIKRVFRECGITVNGWGRYANQCREVTGLDKLNFLWFNSEFTRFPLRLVGARVPRLHEITLLDMFKPPEKNRIVKMIGKSLANEVVKDFAFMFPITRTMFVAHDMPSSDAPERESGRVVWAAHLERPLFLEPSKSLFRMIGSDWVE